MPRRARLAATAAVAVGLTLSAAPVLAQYRKDAQVERFYSGIRALA